MTSKDTCVHYTAHVVPEHCWYFVGVLRSYDHLCFDRTLNVEQSIFEFFVPDAMESDFLTLLGLFAQEGIVLNLSKTAQC